MRHTALFALLIVCLATQGCSDSRRNENAVPTSAKASSHESLASPNRIIPSGFVTDEAQILSPDQERRLSVKMMAFEQRTKHQLAVVTVRSLEGEDIALYTRRLANRWGVGRKGHNDGVMVLVAPHEQAVRIAVGYGLESVLTPTVCQTIIDKSMLPKFRNGDLPSGIEAGTDALIATLG